MYNIHLKLIENLEDYEKAIAYFPQDYLETLKYKQKESIIARYEISKLVDKYFWIKKFLAKVDKNGVPIFENDIFWSISHKKDLIFVGISSPGTIWVDIEVIKPRDESLLDIFSEKEYEILWWKNWTNFYTLWTAKEAIIKKNLWKLDDMKNLVLEKVENIENKIWWIIFTKKIIISWNIVYSSVEQNKILTLST